MRSITNPLCLNSTHTGVVVGKQISKSFYGSEHKKSYYLGCSTGGRQGFKSAQDFPNDFDGVVVGAPAVAFNSLNSWANHFYILTGKNTSENFLPAPLWTTVNTEILNQCDSLDGLKDGIIEDPSLCNFDAKPLLCAPGVTDGCLTSAQVNTVTQVFTGLFGEDGSLIYPRMQPGSELQAVRLYYTGLPSPFAVSSPTQPLKRPHTPNRLTDKLVTGLVQVLCQERPKLGPCNLDSSRYYAGTPAKPI